VRICVCTYGLGTLVIAKQIHRYTDTQIYEITQTQAQTEKVAAAINQSSANLPRHSGTEILGIELCEDVRWWRSLIKSLR